MNGTPYMAVVMLLAVLVAPLAATAPQAAKAIDLTIPPSLLVRADHVIGD